MKISFTTTCMGRVHHLKETLPANMYNNPPSEGVKVEFAVLDYNSKDGMEEWIKTDKAMQGAMESGLLRYGKNDDVQKFHMSHAKNQATRLATGDVVCNVDADNFIGPQFAQFLAESFNRNPKTVMTPSRRVKKEIGGGIWGRVALRSVDFAELGGYDESSFKGWGGEDVDLVRRGKGMGLSNYFIDELRFFDVIRHSNEERAKNMVDTPEELAAEVAKITKINGGDMSRLRRRLGYIKEIFQVLAREVQVNNGSQFGMGRVRIGPENLIQEFGPVSVPRHSRLHINAVNAPEFLIDRLLPQLRNVNSAQDDPFSAQHP